jgi:hypothetical protein
MSNPTPPEKNSPIVALKVVRFDRDISVPGRGMTSAVGVEGDPASGKSWRIDFDLRLRAVRVRYFPRDKKEHEGEVWIPVERTVSWEIAA